MANTTHFAKDQVIGSAVDFINYTRIQQLEEELKRILHNELLAKHQLDESMMKALDEVQKVRDFLNNPENILGSDLTKHGEIAEQIEVHIRNAKDLLEGRTPTATFDNVGRIAPEDYIIDGVKVQSKFINGINNNLDHVLDHMGKYPEFGSDGSFYHIPKDTYKTIQQILDGNPPPGLSQRTIDKIIEKVREIENQTGKSFSEVVKPSLSDYGDVQRGKVNETVDKHEKDIKSRNQEKKDDISKDADEKRKQAHQDGKPSLQEGLKAGLIGAAIGGGLNLALFIYKKHKEGVNITDFTEQDWKDLGIDFAKGSGKGGVTGFSIYGLTNYTKMGAPMASAVVSASFGVSKLAMDYKNGKIDKSEFIAQGQITCLESGMVALGAALGQTIIPIPIVGTLIGSFATSALMNFSKKYLEGQEDEVIRQLNAIYEDAIKKIEAEEQRLIANVLKEYGRLSLLTEMAFNYEMNAKLRFNNSINLALGYEVEDHKILKTLNDVDEYFLA